MDISSVEPDADAGESKTVDAKKAEELSSTPSEKIIEPASEIQSSEEREVTKVLSYGPAPREPEAPEIKVNASAESGQAPEIKADRDAEKSNAEAAPKKDAVPGSALIPFVAQAKEKPSEPAPAKARAWRFEFLHSRGMQAALVAAFLGLGWAAAGSLFSGHSIKPPVQVAAAPEVSETRRLADEVRALKKELEALRTSTAQNQTPEELRALKKNVDALKNGLEGTKSEMGASLAQLSAKLDHAQHDPAKLREISDRLDHIERGGPLTTASIAPPSQQTEQAAKPAPAPVPLPPVKVQAQTIQPQSTPVAVPAKPSPAPAMSTATSERPQLISNWVVRDVYDGIALVEGPRGSIEVVEGETIPGVGTVKSIERRGSGWIVVTTRGLVDSARN